MFSYFLFKTFYTKYYSIYNIFIRIHYSTFKVFDIF